jgi:hypothetical protein
MRFTLPFALILGCYNPTIPDNGFSCMKDPTCPEGFSCLGGFCVKSTMGGGGQSWPVINIPKSGAPYAGPKTDPMLNDINACPDASLEPNDSPATALGFTPTPDAQTAAIVKLAICPTGNSPFTGQHDVDFFKVDNTSGPASLSLVAKATYDITFGDLDLGIFDSNLNPMSLDGTAVANACAAASISNGVYYVIVVGANNVDVNNYSLLIRSFAKPTSCM